MKSNPSSSSCEAGFHRVSDFIHRRWISSVEDGFDWRDTPIRVSRQSGKAFLFYVFRFTARQTVFPAPSKSKVPSTPQETISPAPTVKA
jgi:hypothetical protein